MIFGHNTNVKLAGVAFHVQTEDRGESHALLDTTVYYQGRVLHRRTNNYFDLLPLDDDRNQALKLRLDAQHQNVLDEISSGSLQLSIPQPPPATVPVAALPASGAAPSALSVASDEAETAAAPRKLKVELINPKSWLSGRHATLQVAVREENGDPVANAKIEVHIEGSADEQVESGTTGINGKSQIEFDMPKITGAEAAIAIQAQGRDAKGQLRFVLRAKPKIPVG